MAEHVQRLLSAFDYVLFGLMLVISLMIGVIYAVRDRKSKQGTEGYLMAGRSMTAIPVGVSLAVSFQSSVTIIGIPNDVYLYGITYLWSLISLGLTFLVITFVFVPTLYHLRITSAYEYLGQRYSKMIRLAATSYYLVTNVLYMGINIYGPALTLSRVTGFDLLSAMLSTGLVCVIYTTLGGLRGVIWTDVFQGLVMVAGMLAILIRGCVMQGGIANVWDIASAAGRTHSNYSADPHIRYTILTVLTGAFILWCGIFGTSQAQVQRMLSVKSHKEAVKALGVGVIGIAIYTTLAVLCGAISYTVFAKCDPKLVGCIDRNDEIYAFGVFNMFYDIPGLTGLFLACVFSASLSTVSSGVNSMSTVVMADFIKPHTKWSERVNTWIARGATLLIGCLSLGIGILAAVVGDIVKLAIASASAFICPCLAIFILGIWCPFVNSWGAICGLTSGFTTSVVMYFGSTGIGRDEEPGQLELSTERCPENCDFSPSANTTFVYIERPYNSSAPEAELRGIDHLYALSMYYGIAIVFFTSLVVAVVVSLLTGGWKRRHEVKHHLIRPPFQSKMFNCIPQSIRACFRCGIDWSEDSVVDNPATSIDEKPEARPLTDFNENI